MGPAALLLLVGLLQPALATRGMLQLCGAAGTPCGASLATSSPCTKSPGACQPGLFCGWVFSQSDQTTKCMPMPKGCGAKEGAPCCPGNAQAAVRNASAPTPKPTCASGLTCFFTPTPDASGWSSPPFSSPAGSLLGTCRKVAADCGAQGKACCPSLYQQATNPPVATAASSGALCSGSLWCNTTSTQDAGGNYWSQGVCLPQKASCGKFGSACCIETSGVSTNAVCGNRTWNAPASQRGYCSYPGGKATGDMRDQACKQCPDAKTVAADPMAYWGCPSSQ